MNRSGHIGKIKKRLEDAKNRWARLPKLDFSSNESARLATDALLDGGEEAYRRVLGEEGEVEFLSPTESRFILDNCQVPRCAPDAPSQDDNKNSASPRLSTCCDPLKSEGSEPLELPGWQPTEKPYLKDKASATVYFQAEKSNNIRETVRRCIHRTSQVLAVVMDEFTDAEIFCDVLEAAHKRNVFVYLLLDQSKLKLFTEMCDKLQIRDIHLKNISIRSITGEVYCAKSGKKFSGQIQEKFLISDWRLVLSGSYSFTWLSGQVHRNILSKFSGQAVELFEEEFRFLYGLSKTVIDLKSPAPATPVLLRENSTTQSILTDSSNRESANTTSEPFSSSSTNSFSQNNQPPTSPVYSVTSPTSPLQRVNSFHGYSALVSPTSSSNRQTTYFQRQYAVDLPTLYANANIYRSVRNRPEEVLSRMTYNWRFLNKPTVM
ncbi:protein FAM83A [Microcaecilia unicolor]|uniref:Protein FAM83A n=1 Tax=Microcaecilia unicolor TaxID=1415580 RepID=A0A6P7X788_9AMPH|nr:protein FAM83A [Microcaecilia unicolor]